MQVLWHDINFLNAAGNAEPQEAYVPESTTNRRPGTLAMAQPRFSEAAIARVADAIRRGAIAAGPLVREFEGRLEEALPHPHVIACANGTAALHAALWSVGVGPGQVVVTTAFSFVASASAIVHCGASPAFSDIDDSCNMDPAALENTLAHLEHTGRRAAAVVFVHLYGNPTNVDLIVEVCNRHGVALVEDCAQAFGAKLGGTPVSGFGRVSAFSFYATKNVAAGEGGALSSPDAALIERARKFINHGRLSGYEHELIGYNYRMSDLHAALAIDQLDSFAGNQARRAANAEGLSRSLVGLPSVHSPRVTSEALHSHHQFTMLVPAGVREDLRKHLEQDGINSAVHYPKALPSLECFQNGPGTETATPKAIETSTRCLSVPVHPQLSPADIQRIGDSIRAFFASTD